MKKLVTLIILLAITISGCKKYDEGPLISLRSAEKRILKHPTKRIVEYTENGVDKLPYINSFIGCNKYTLTFNSEQVGAYEYDNWITFDAFGDTTCENNVLDEQRRMIWGFKSQSKNKEFAFQFNTYDKYIFKGFFWKIERLTIDDLWLIKEENNKTYTLKFESVR